MLAEHTACRPPAGVRPCRFVLRSLQMLKLNLIMLPRCPFVALGRCGVGLRAAHGRSRIFDGFCYLDGMGFVIRSALQRDIYKHEGRAHSCKASAVCTSSEIQDFCKLTEMCHLSEPPNSDGAGRNASPSVTLLNSLSYDPYVHQLLVAFSVLETLAMRSPASQQHDTFSNSGIRFRHGG